MKTGIRHSGAASSQPLLAGSTLRPESSLRDGRCTTSAFSAYIDLPWLGPPQTGGRGSRARRNRHTMSFQTRCWSTVSRPPSVEKRFGTRWKPRLSKWLLLQLETSGIVCGNANLSGCRSSERNGRRPKTSRWRTSAILKGTRHGNVLSFHVPPGQ